MAPRKPQDAPGAMIPAQTPSQGITSIRIDLQDVVSDWMSHLKATTRRVYERALLDFAAFCGVATVREVAAMLCATPQGKANAIVMKYRNMLTERLAPSSVNVKLSALLSLNDVCRVSGFVEWRLEFRLLKTEGYRDTAGSGVDAIEAVFEKLSLAKDPGSVRDLAILSVIYRQGFRRGELVSLDLDHVDLDSGKMWVMGKGRVQRKQVTLTPLAIEALKRWILVRGGDPGALFLSLDTRSRGNRLTGLSIWRIVKGYGLGWPHAMRHTAVSEVLVRSNGNILMAQQFARHNDPKITLKYWDNIRDVAGDAARLLDKPKEEQK